jgi:hypothetical protein
MSRQTAKLARIKGPVLGKGGELKMKNKDWTDRFQELIEKDKKGKVADFTPHQKLLIQRYKQMLYEKNTMDNTTDKFLKYCEALGKFEAELVENGISVSRIVKTFKKEEIGL